VYSSKKSIAVALGLGALALIWSAASAAQFADLMVKIKGPAQAKPGEDIGEQVKILVKNSGRKKALGTEHSKNGYVLDLVLSSDRNVEVKPATYSESFHEDVMLRGGRISRTNTLAPGETARYRVGATIPRDTPAGTYCLGIIVDSFNRVPESNEENNVKCAKIQIGGGRPDLYVSEFQLKPNPPTQGEPVGVRVGVYNRGDAPAGGFRVQWWAGKNFPGPACTWKVDRLPARGGRIVQCRYKGYKSWYAKLDTKIVVDVDRNVRESNERNNLTIETISVRRR
jgi:hypothetical protein